MCRRVCTFVVSGRWWNARWQKYSPILGAVRVLPTRRVLLSLVFLRRVLPHDVGPNKENENNCSSSVTTAAVVFRDDRFRRTVRAKRRRLYRWRLFYIPEKSHPSLFVRDTAGIWRTPYSSIRRACFTTGLVRNKTFIRASGRNFWKFAAYAV